MNWSEDRLAEAKRHIQEAEARVARQAAVVERDEIAGDERAAEQAGETLVLMRVNLALAVLLLGFGAMAANDGAERQAQPAA
jgi:hypothetical protein